MLTKSSRVINQNCHTLKEFFGYLPLISYQYHLESEKLEISATLNTVWVFLFFRYSIPHFHGNLRGPPNATRPRNKALLRDY